MYGAFDVVLYVVIIQLFWLLINLHLILSYLWVGPICLEKCNFGFSKSYSSVVFLAVTHFAFMYNSSQYCLRSRA